MCLRTPQEVERRLEAERSWTGAEALQIIEQLHERVAGESAPGGWVEAELRLFGNPAEFITNDEEHGRGIFASLMEGPAIALTTYAGINLSDNSFSKLDDSLSWQDLVEEAGGEIFEIGEQDEVPGMSDVLYWISIADPAAFARSLRVAIVRCLQLKAPLGS